MRMKQTTWYVDRVGCPLERVNILAIDLSIFGLGFWLIAVVSAMSTVETEPVSMSSSAILMTKLGLKL